MSRQLDPEALSEQDLEYIKQRPWLRQEMILQGYGDPLKEDEPPEDPIVLTKSPSADRNRPDPDEDEDE